MVGVWNNTSISAADYSKPKPLFLQALHNGFYSKSFFFCSGDQEWNLSLQNLARGQRHFHAIRARRTDEDEELFPCSAGVQMRFLISGHRSTTTQIPAWGAGKREQICFWKQSQAIKRQSDGWLMSCKSWICAPYKGHISSAICTLGHFGDVYETEAHWAIGKEGEQSMEGAINTYGDGWPLVPGSYMMLSHKQDVTKTLNPG